MMEYTSLGHKLARLLESSSGGVSHFALFAHCFLRSIESPIILFGQHLLWRSHTTYGNDSQLGTVM